MTLIYPHLFQISRHHFCVDILGHVVSQFKRILDVDGRENKGLTCPKQRSDGLCCACFGANHLGCKIKR